MSTVGEKDELKQFLTDFDGAFSAKLFGIGESRHYQRIRETGATGVSTGYLAYIRAKYDRDLMRKIESGLFVAVKNFKAKGNDRYTLFEIARALPKHYGMEGIREDTYYPFQYELAAHAVQDWDVSDPSTMQIVMRAVPINFDLILERKEDNKLDLNFEKGWTQPVPGEKVLFLNRRAIEIMYNRKVLKSLGFEDKDISDLGEDPKRNPRLGVMEIFPEEGIPVFVDFKKLVRYHWGTFSYTGGGKSNFVSNVIRRLLYHTDNTNILVFDISAEYVVLLLDLLGSEEIASVIVTDRPYLNWEDFYRASVKPDTLEPIDLQIKKAFEQMIKAGRIKVVTEPREELLTYETILSNLAGQDDKYAIVRDLMIEEAEKFLRKKGLSPEDPMGKEAIELANALKLIVEDTGQRWGPADIPNVVRAAAERERLKEGERMEGTIAINELVNDLLDSKYRLVVFNVTDPVKIRKFAVRIIKELLKARKQEFSIEPYIQLVFDEAQEFIPAEAASRKGDYTRQSTKTIENLLRHGRKYGLGGCISTQRIAHLNTNALQQLHTYFIGTLPRPYDRILIADTFAIPHEILEKTLEFSTGEWLLSSYNATGIPNVPIFMKADNAEIAIQNFLQ